jgi:hypothetical protein
LIYRWRRSTVDLIAGERHEPGACSATVDRPVGKLIANIKNYRVDTTVDKPAAGPVPLILFISTPYLRPARAIG